MTCQPVSGHGHEVAEDGAGRRLTTGPTAIEHHLTGCSAST